MRSRPGAGEGVRLSTCTACTGRFLRARDDKTGCEPRQLFNVVEFCMVDKDGSGSIDVDECMEILFRRYGSKGLEQKVDAFMNQVRRRVACA